MAEKPGHVGHPIPDKTDKGRLRSATERTIPMFQLHEMAPHEAEALAVKAKKKADAAAKRAASKVKKKKLDEAYEKGIAESNERNGVAS